MAPTSTPVRPSTAPSATTAAGLAPTGPTMTRGERDRLTSDLRMACMRISRRVRFESTAPVAPHQFSVLVAPRGAAAHPQGARRDREGQRARA